VLVPATFRVRKLPVPQLLVPELLFLDLVAQGLLLLPLPTTLMTMTPVHLDSLSWVAEVTQITWVQDRKSHVIVPWNAVDLTLTVSYVNKTNQMSIEN
jgi:hypothetical protein